MTQSLTDLVAKVRSLPVPTIIGVSGLGGAGKSTISKELGETLNIPVVGIDSFQNKGAFDSDYVLWEIMDYNRLEREVLIPFLNGEEHIRYGHFDAGEDKILETREFRNEGKLIVEGVGLFRPGLLNYFGYKIWIDCPLDQALSRGKTRDREEYNSPNDELWEGLWKKNDQEYIDAYNPQGMADMIFKNCED